jgi:hypothetical protein
MYSFNVHKDTYPAIIQWLNILNIYDDNFKRGNIAEYKSRRIQQQAANMTGSAPTQDFTLINLEVDESNYYNPNQEEDGVSDKPKIDKADADMHAMELQVYIETVEERANLEEELENLSDTLTDFVDIDDNLIDYLM